MNAEDKFRELLEERYPDQDEEFKTQLFHDEFRLSVQEDSTSCRVEHAFVRDLAGAFPHLQESKELL